MIWKRDEGSNVGGCVGPRAGGFFGPCCSSTDGKVDAASVVSLCADKLSGAWRHLRVAGVSCHSNFFIGVCDML